MKNQNYYREYRKKNKDKFKIYSKRWASKNKHKIRAESYIWKLIRTKRISTKPCVICGNIKSQAHHPDYNYKNIIIWLCYKHHKGVHHGMVKLYKKYYQTIPEKKYKKKCKKKIKKMKKEVNENVSAYFRQLAKKSWKSRKQKLVASAMAKETTSLTHTKKEEK